MSVCLSARLSQKPHVKTSRNFLYMLIVAVARTFCDDSAIRYVLPVLWMTCFHIMAPTEQNQTRRYVWSSSPGGGPWGKV